MKMNKNVFRFVTMALILLLYVGIVKAQDNTIVLMQKDLPYEDQNIFYSGYGNAPQTDSIKAYWNEEKYITSAAYTTKGWLITMAKNSGYTDQVYHHVPNWPSSWINEKIEKGYYITSVAADNGNWFIVMSQGTGFTSQIWKLGSWTDLEPWIQTNWNSGYYITQATNVGSSWLIIMSQTDKYQVQSYFGATTTTEFFEAIQQKWSEHYVMTLMEYGNGTFWGVASKLSDDSVPVQQCWVNLDDVNTNVKEYWDKGYEVAYIGGGYRNSSSADQSDGNRSVAGQILSGIGTVLSGIVGGDNPTKEKTWKACSSCRGTGRCSNCHGTGKYSQSKKGKCGVCLGTGKCAGCHGAGGHHD